MAQLEYQQRPGKIPFSLIVEVLGHWAQACRLEASFIGMLLFRIYTP